MNSFSPQLLEQIDRVAQEVPASALDSLIRVLINADLNSAKLKHELEWLPRASWRQVTGNLIDVWRTEANLLEGKAIAIALATAVHCQTKLQQELSVELVWTGPNPESLPLRRTDQTLLQMIRSAQRDLLIVSFAIYDIAEIVQALAVAITRGVNVRIVAETPEESGGKIAFGINTAFDSKILSPAQIYIWLKEKRPIDEQKRYGSLHAKCAVCDQQHLFVSSANLTEYAMSLNIEMGVLIHNQNLAKQVIQQINTLIFHGILTLQS